MIRPLTLFAACILGALVTGGVAVSDECRLVTDYEPRAIPSLPRPEYLVRTTDPVFGSTVVRVTDPGRPVVGEDASLDGLVWGDVARHHYSLDQAWNADMTLLMLDRGTPGEVFLDGRTYRPVFHRDRRGEHRWHPTDPALQLWIEGNQAGYWRVKEDRLENVSTIHGYSDFVFGPGKGNPSLDGSMVAITGRRDADGKTVTFAFDLLKGTKYADIDMSQFKAPTVEEPNDPGVSISPLGTYVAVFAMSFDLNAERADGTQIYDLEGNRVGPYWSEYGLPSHWDMIADETGDEWAVGVAKSGAFQGRMVKRRLRDGKITPLTPVRAWGDHTSCRNLFRPGWCYVTYAASKPFAFEILAVATDGSGRVERYAHTHAEVGGYLDGAHGSASPDGSRIIFSSNWDNAGGQIAAYVVEPLFASTPSANSCR